MALASISVILPTFNRAAFLIEALNSVLAQTRPVHEIIVWDDGSTDGTGDAVASLGEVSVPIRYFRAENGGKSRALNRAMQETTGTHIWICDDDDICRSDAAERMLQEMARSGAPVVAGRYERFGSDPETGQPVDPHPGYWPDLSGGSLLRHLLEDIFLFQNATLATREAYEHVGPFREDLPRAIDYDMIVRLAVRFPMSFVDAVLFEQRKHTGARGPAAARHKAVDMDAVWRGADRDIFRDFHGVLPLSLYEAMFETPEPELATRAALLQRGAVLARHDLWDLALTDFETAAGMTGAGGLTRVEWDICIRAMAGKHGCAGALEPPIARGLTALGHKARLGRDVSRALARGLRWRIAEAKRNGALGRAMTIAALMLRLGGPGSFMAAPPSAAGADRLSERRELPITTYSW